MVVIFRCPSCKKTIKILNDFNFETFLKAYLCSCGYDPLKNKSDLTFVKTQKELIIFKKI